MVLPSRPTLDELAAACAAEGIRLTLQLVSPAGDYARDREAARSHLLELRAFSRTGLPLARRRQSRPGRESIHELAGQVAASLRDKRLLR